ncbi:MAG: (2Fe-2S)-binding protein [Bacillota bacterium]
MSDRDQDVVICRCEDVTLAEIRRLVAEGACTLDEIKRLTRAGMGLCQGRTCRHLILQEVSRLTGVPVEELVLPTFRPPTRPVKLGVIARAAAAHEAGAGVAAQHAVGEVPACQAPAGDGGHG